MQVLEIKTRKTATTYCARVIGQSLQATCTAGIEPAVDALKLKYCPHGITKKILPNSAQNRTRLKSNITHLIITQ